MKIAAGYRWSFVLLAAGVLSACGGGGGGSDNHPPTANAGAAQTVNKAATVSLDASASSDPDGDSLSYRWREISGPTVSLSSSTGAHPTFTAPSKSGPLVLGVVVNDGHTDSAEATVTITVQDRAPAANAGQNTSVGVGVKVVLDGTASSDPDGDTLTYSWTQISGPAVQITAASASQAGFISPATNAILQFQLTVSDGELSATQTVTITVDPHVGNAPPVANAGSNQTWPRRSSVTLFGRGMDPEGHPITYKWAQVSGPTVTLQNADLPYADFVASETPAVYVFSLTVNDGVQDSAPSQVTITVQNFPPVLNGVALSPAAPQTADNLTVSGSASDADSDPVVLSYVWKRNGVVLAGRNTATLAASDTSKGDVISVTVTASDGTAQSSQDATTTILDTQAVLTAVSAPAQVNYGDNVSFQVTGSDADGDPIAGFEVAYGPAGMGVDSNGHVSWQAVSPMFDRSTDFNWGIRLHNQPRSLVSGTLTVKDQTRQYPLRRTGIDMPIARSGVVVTDLDGDGIADTLVLGYGDVYELQHSGSTYVQTWVYPFAGGTDASEYSFGAVTAADIDGDRKQEIYFTDLHVIVMLDGVNRREMHRLDLGTETCASLIVADVDLDGTPDLLCLAVGDSPSTSQHLLVLRATDLSLEWEVKDVDLGTSLAVGNVDTDPALEIITSNGYVYDGATHQTEWAYGPGFGAPVVVGNVDGTGPDEIVGSGAPAGTTAGITVFSAVTKSVRASVTGQSVAAIAVADLDHDGKAEIVVGGFNWDGLAAYAYDRGTASLTKLWSVRLQSSLAYLNSISSLAVGDVDGDGIPEVVYGAGIGAEGTHALLISGTSPPVTLKYNSPAQLSSQFLGGNLTRIGGGAQRLVFYLPETNEGYSPGLFAGLDPVTGHVDLSPITSDSFAMGQGTTAADFDGDGVDDLCAATTVAGNGAFIEYDFATDTRKWFSPGVTGVGVAMTHADLKGDGGQELIALSSTGHLYVYDVKAQTLLWASPQLTSGGVDVEAADMDGDGKIDIVALGPNDIAVYARDSTPSGYTQRNFSHMADKAIDLLVADTDGDGKPEVYVLTAHTFQTASIRVFDNQLVPQRTIPLGVYATSLSLERSQFPRKNLVVSVSPTNAIPWVADKSSLWSIDPVSGTPVWKSPSFVGDVPVNSVTFPDLNGDGVPEIVIGTNSGMYLTR